MRGRIALVVIVAGLLALPADALALAGPLVSPAPGDVLAPCLARIKRLPVPPFQYRIDPQASGSYTDQTFDPAHIVFAAQDLGRCSVVRHELGHAFDAAYMTDGLRRWFSLAILRDRRPWRTRPNSPHEKFAEAYRSCATIRAYHRVWDGYDLRLSAAGIRRACRLMLHAAAAQAGCWGCVTIIRRRLACARAASQLRPSRLPLR